MAPPICIFASVGKGLSYAMPLDGDIKAAVQCFSEAVSRYPEESKKIFLGNTIEGREQQMEFQKYKDLLKKLEGRNLPEYIDFINGLKNLNHG